MSNRGCFRSGAVESDLTNGDRAVRQMDDLGFSADWWVDYRGLIAQRQAETISAADLGRLVAMSEALEKANVPRIEALGKMAQLRGCSIEEVMASRRPEGLCAGEFTIPDDFEAPLSEDILQAFENPE
jgi:hypothetical protein